MHEFRGAAQPTTHELLFGQGAPRKPKWGRIMFIILLCVVAVVIFILSYVDNPIWKPTPGLRSWIMVVSGVIAGLSVVFLLVLSLNLEVFRGILWDYEVTQSSYKGSGWNVMTNPGSDFANTGQVLGGRSPALNHRS